MKNQAETRHQRVLEATRGDIAGLGEGEGQLARAEYKLAVLYEEKGMRTESAHCRGEALRLRRKLRPQDENAPLRKIRL